LRLFFARSDATSYLLTIHDEERLEQDRIMMFVGLSDTIFIARELLMESLDVFLDAGFGAFDREKLIDVIHEGENMCFYKTICRLISCMDSDHTNQCFEAVGDDSGFLSAS
jgi:hypothetical protein